ncbi:MAG: DUF2799 domain-containing protein [Caulobacterales bacterium]|nr:DUF2799 domain-containing protein [Caulobacterales bacterium]
MRTGAMTGAAGAAALLAAGCASIDEETCLSGDWRAIGYQDGVQGLSRDRLEARRRACARAGVLPYDAAWASGYQQGLAAFCTAETALELGVKGSALRGHCPPDRTAAFRAAHEAGKTVASAERVLKTTREQRTEAREEVYRLERRIEARERKSSNTEYSYEVRDRAFQELKEALRDLSRAEGRYGSLSRQVDAREEDLKKARRALAAAYPDWARKHHPSWARP